MAQIQCWSARGKTSAPIVSFRQPANWSLALALGVLIVAMMVLNKDIENGL